MIVENNIIKLYEDDSGILEVSEDEAELDLNPGDYLFYDNINYSTLESFISDLLRIICKGTVKVLKETSPECLQFTHNKCNLYIEVPRRRNELDIKRKVIFLSIRKNNKTYESRIPIYKMSQIEHYVEVYYK